MNNARLVVFGRRCHDAPVSVDDDGARGTGPDVDSEDVLRHPFTTTAHDVKRRARRARRDEDVILVESARVELCGLSDLCVQVRRAAAFSNRGIMA